MNEALLAIAQDACLYFSTAVVLALTSREFGLYNLAGGAWLIVGGWAVAAFVSPPGYPSPVHALMLLAFIPLGLVQVLMPVLLRNRVIRNPSSYLFVSLGIALVINSLAPAWLLASAGATIPLDRGAFGVLGLIAIISVAAVVVQFVFSGSRWARLVVWFRTANAGDRSNRLWYGLSFLVLLELILLLSVGAAGSFVHKGVFGSSEYRTVIPLLALVATKSRPIKAGLLSAAVVVVAHLVTASGSAIRGLEITEYARVVAIALLVGIVFFTRRPSNALILAQVVAVPARLERGWKNLWSEREWRNHSAGAALLVLLVLLGQFLASRYRSLLVDEDIHRAMLIVLLGVTSWFAQRSLGVATVAWPAVGVLPLFAYFLAGSVGELLLMIAGLSVLWLGHLWLLRTFSHESSLVIDLAIVVSVHQAVKSSPGISGSDEVLIFEPAIMSMGSEWLLAGQVTLALLLLLFIWSTARFAGPRSVSLGVANFKLGLSHGVPVRSAFIGLSSICVVAALIATASFHLVSRPITAHGLSLEAGMLVYMFGYLLHRTSLLTFVPIVFFVYAFLGSIMAGQGALFGALVGSALIFTSLVFEAQG